MNKSILWILAGLGLYYYLNNYGPSGASFNNGVQVAPTYWQSFFSGTTTTTSPAQNTTTTTTTTAGATTNASGITGPTSVAPDINNSLKGTITLNGTAMTINVIPSAAGQSSGLIWNTSGQDITQQFTAAEQAQILQAFTTAPHTTGLSALMNTPSIRPQTAPPSRSPWGSLPYVN